jgi:hypothetical protein
VGAVSRVLADGRATPIGGAFCRLREESSFDVTVPGKLRLSFAYTFGSHKPVHFALYYPFSYSDCQRLLRNIDQALGSEPSTAASAGRILSGVTAPSATSSARERLKARLKHTGDPAADVYYHRELLVHSIEGRRVELLTITSCTGKNVERESTLEGLFPEKGPRPHRFRGKPAIYVGARVHPGESASSYMVHGLIAFLLQPRNPYARLLRNRFVFKIVPMINPDGVARGHFRTDTFGGNLNRQYAAPTLAKQPAIFAIKAVLKQASQLCTPVNLEGSSRGGGNSVFAFIDLHGYTARHGCYVIGNSLPPHREGRSLMFAQLLQLYSPQFNANACSFGKGKRGTGSKRSVYATPYGQLIPSALTPFTLPASGSDGADRRSSLRDDDDGGATPAGESNDDDDDDDDEDGADGGASPMSQGEEEDAEATRAEALRASTGASSPLHVSVEHLDHESYPGELARLHDPHAEVVKLLAPGQRTGPANARLSDSEASRISREWNSLKSRVTGGRGEGQKEGTGRACVHKELNVPHCYTVECSCNLLSHRRVYDRVYAASHVHNGDKGHHHAEAHGEVDHKAAEEALTTATSSDAGGPKSPIAWTAPGSSRMLSRVAKVKDKKTVECHRCEEPMRSQLTAEQGRELRAAISEGHDAPQHCLLRRAPSYAARNPYSCQVDSLQPPPSCESYTPPFGFHCEPPKGTSFVCPWGTCPNDPPSVFAAVGRGLAFALLDISGGTSGLYSRVTHSQWGSVASLHKWSRRCAGAAYGVTENGSAMRVSARAANQIAREAALEAVTNAREQAKQAIASGRVALRPPVVRKAAATATSAGASLKVKTSSSTPRSHLPKGSPRRQSPRSPRLELVKASHSPRAPPVVFSMEPPPRKPLPPKPAPPTLDTASVSTSVNASTWLAPASSRTKGDSGPPSGWSSPKRRSTGDSSRLSKRLDEEEASVDSAVTRTTFKPLLTHRTRGAVFRAAGLATMSADDSTAEHGVLANGVVGGGLLGNSKGIPDASWEGAPEEQASVPESAAPDLRAERILRDLVSLNSSRTAHSARSRSNGVTQIVAQRLSVSRNGRSAHGGARLPPRGSTASTKSRSINASSLLPPHAPMHPRGTGVGPRKASSSLDSQSFVHA